jgi:hypothetical protein
MMTCSRGDGIDVLWGKSEVTEEVGGHERHARRPVGRPCNEV